MKTPMNTTSSAAGSRLREIASGARVTEVYRNENRPWHELVSGALVEASVLRDPLFPGYVRLTRALSL